VAITVGEIKKFAEVPLLEGKKDEPARAATVADALMRATVWVRPTATDVQPAGVLVGKDLVLTCTKGLRRGDRVGIAFPIRAGDRWLCERASYKDPVDLALRGCWRSGDVLACDSDRELALIRLESTPAFCKPLRFSPGECKSGRAVHTMSHPGGLEFAWVYASGSVRQHGSIALATGEKARRVRTLVCQLPAQVGSPGGPVMNDAGELVGIVASRESTQMVGYAVSTDEIAEFLDVALPDHPPQTWDGLVARSETFLQRVTSSLAQTLALRAEANRLAGGLKEAKRDCDTALSLDPACGSARLCRARMLEADLSRAELDSAVETGAFSRELFLERARQAILAKDWRKARGSLERILDVNPLDAAARQQLIGALLELNEDAKALTAAADTLRADQKCFPSLCKDLLTQAEAMATKFPDAPEIPAGWLVKALTAAEKVLGLDVAKEPVRDLLKRAAAAKDDGKRLDLLRDGLIKLGGR
jgi:hypothetical protein